MTVPSTEKITVITKAFSSARSKFENFAEEIARILEEALPGVGIKFQAIESRAKTIESFEQKCRKLNPDGNFKYTDPLSQITDLAGVRIITFTLGDVAKVCEFLEKHFDVQEKKDIGDERLDEGKFGYHSIHYLCGLPANRLALPEIARYTGMICEIQVRTVLQHVWAQIEHGVQYKASSALPKSIKRKFVSLAGLLEIGDREFQTIESEFEALKEAVQSEFEIDLTKEAFGNNSNAPISSNIAQSSGADAEAFKVRDLVAKGHYSKAISAYDSMIVEEPKNVTLYLGRAKAKFLSGDIDGAEADIQTAGYLQPYNRDVINLRERIIEGNISNAPTNKNLEQANKLLMDGHEALRAGDGVVAYDLYSQAAELGASRAFSLMNLALACLLAGDTAGASTMLNSLEIRHGTMMEINILGLRAIIFAGLQEDEAQAEAIAALEKAIRAKGDFSFALSPLKFLKDGLIAKFGELQVGEYFGRIFQTLETE